RRGSGGGRSVSSGSGDSIIPFAGILGQQGRRDAAAEEASPASERQRFRCVVTAPYEPEPLEPPNRVPVDRLLEPGHVERLVQPPAQGHTPPFPCASPD